MSRLEFVLEGRKTEVKSQVKEIVDNKVLVRLNSAFDDYYMGGTYELETSENLIMGDLLTVDNNIVRKAREGEAPIGVALSDASIGSEGRVSI